MAFKLYTLNEPITNEIRYVGYTSKSLEYRFCEHWRKRKTHSINSYKNKWLRTLDRLSLKPTIHLLEECSSHDEILRREIEVIAEYKRLGYRLTNNTDGGQGNVGYKMPKEVIEKISAMKIGKKLPPWTNDRRIKTIAKLKGRKMLPEQIQKMKGRVVSEDVKKQTSERFKGKKLSDSTKFIMGQARKKEWAEGKRKGTRTGMKNSDSHKEKMSGLNNPFYGKTHSPEMRKLISEQVLAANARRKNKQ